MEGRARRLTAVASAVAILVCFPLPPPAAAGSGRLEGRVFDPDGRPASAYSVLLVDRQGEKAGEAATSGEGRFAFLEVPSGEYHLAVADPKGRLVPVLGPLARVEPAAAVQRNLRLVHNEGPTGLASAGAYGVRPDSWWARQTRNQKIFTLVAIGVGAGIIVWLAGDSNDEKTASPSGP